MEDQGSNGEVGSDNKRKRVVNCQTGQRHMQAKRREKEEILEGLSYTTQPNERHRRRARDWED